MMARLRWNGGTGHHQTKLKPSFRCTVLYSTYNVPFRYSEQYVKTGIYTLPILGILGLLAKHRPAGETPVSKKSPGNVKYVRFGSSFGSVRMQMLRKHVPLCYRPTRSYCQYILAGVIPRHPLGRV